MEDFTSMPKVPSLVPLNLGITTRVMAKRLAQNKAQISELKRNNTQDEILRHRRRSSKFLEGTAIPNSVIQSEMERRESQESQETAKKRERDEFVDKLMKRLQPQKKVIRSIYDEDVDREALNKIKKELQRRSLLPLNTDNETDKKSISIPSSISKSIKDPWEELKEKRRITRRTSILAPLSAERRPTYESIKKAIEDSKIIQQLLDADNIEQQKFKQIEEEKSLMPEETNENENVVPVVLPLEQRTDSQNVVRKPSKKDSVKVKDKKALGRKKSSNSRSERSLTMNERPSKQKGNTESKKTGRRSTNARISTELPNRRNTSSTSNNATQRRYTY